MSDVPNEALTTTAFSVDDMIAEVAGDPTFPVTLKSGRVLTFRKLTDASELIRIQKHCGVTQKIISSGGTPDMQPWCRGTEKGVVTAAVFIEALIVEPKLTLVDCLKLGKQAGALLLEIGDEVMAQVGSGVMRAEEDEIDDLKNA